MKVLDLRCRDGHGFEGWFGSEDDFQSQLQRGLVQCPLCGIADVHKGLSAPRLNRKSNTAAPAVPTTTAASSAPVPAGERTAVTTAPSETDRQLQAAWLQMARQIVARTEDVGDRFAQEARRMHHGEIDERAIRGQASAEETAALLDEGIAVMPLLLPDAAKETPQ